jgi:hypothetical protein
MFELYTERARRVIFFFARYEAAVLASSSIDAEHLLRGVLRKRGGLTRKILDRSDLTHRAVFKKVQARHAPALESVIESVPTSVTACLSQRPPNERSAMRTTKPVP